MVAVIGGACAASPNYPTFACLKALNALAVVVSVSLYIHPTHFKASFTHMAKFLRASKSIVLTILKSNFWLVLLQNFNRFNFLS